MSITKQRWWDHVATDEDRARYAARQRTSRAAGAATRRYYGTPNWHPPAGYAERFAELREGGLNIQQAKRAIDVLVRAETQK